MDYLIHISQHNYKVGSLIIPVLQMRKPSFKEGELHSSPNLTTPSPGSPAFKYNPRIAHSAPFQLPPPWSKTPPALTWTTFNNHFQIDTFVSCPVQSIPDITAKAIF